jgi:thymidylate synthase
VIVSDRVIDAQNVSIAWADAVAVLLELGPPYRAVNLAIRITDPRAEEEPIRELAERLAAKLGMQDIGEVANTIFPAEWAKDFPDPGALSADYREHYAFLRSLGNPQGTYFGRLVAYPDSDGSKTIDQLVDNVTKLQAARRRGRLYKSVYEFNIYSAARDRKKSRGFPCLAHIGLHIGADERLNASALYRSHDVIAKGYGNYLGLGGLLGYIAEASEMEPGELQVNAGGAFFEAAKAKQLTEIRAELEELRVPDQS